MDEQPAIAKRFDLRRRPAADERRSRNPSCSSENAADEDDRDLER